MLHLATSPGRDLVALIMLFCLGDSKSRLLSGSQVGGALNSSMGCAARMGMAGLVGLVCAVMVSSFGFLRGVGFKVKKRPRPERCWFGVKKICFFPLELLYFFPEIQNVEFCKFLEFGGDLLPSGQVLGRNHAAIRTVQRLRAHRTCGA